MTDHSTRDAAPAVAASNATAAPLGSSSPDWLAAVPLEAAGAAAVAAEAVAVVAILQILLVVVAAAVGAYRGEDATSPRPLTTRALHAAAAARRQE